MWPSRSTAEAPMLDPRQNRNDDAEVDAGGLAAIERFRAATKARQIVAVEVLLPQPDPER